MISYLEGKITYKQKDSVIIEVSNIGYNVFVRESFLNLISVDQVIRIFTYQHVREDSISLYGFTNLEELDFFEMLISVSGIGPKSALSILGLANLVDIKESIVRGDSHLLTKVSGIGKKTAERIILELKDKLIKLGGAYDLSTGQSFSADEIDALMSLGYSMAEAREALSQIDDQLSNSGERIKQALKKLSK